MYFSGYWRLLDTDYKEHVVVRILTLLEEKDWSYEAVPMKECCDILEELEPRCVRKQYNMMVKCTSQYRPIYIYTSCNQSSLGSEEVERFYLMGG